MKRTPVCLKAERLILDEMRGEDLEPLAEMLCDPITMKHFPRPFTRADAQVWLERQQQRYREYGFGLWAVRLCSTGEFVGDCGLAVQRVDGIEEIEVGWHLLRRHWHQGYATEAARAVQAYAFGTLGLKRVISLVRPENEPSCAVARRLGMAIEKETMHAELRHFVFTLAAP